MTKKRGIDISTWQGSVDFAKVKESGVQFAILRSGFSQTVDNRFFEYVKGCKNAGIPILGVYHFSYALNAAGAEAEAAFCLDQMAKAGLGKETIVFFDFEYDTVEKAKKNHNVTLGYAECNANTKAFCEYVEKQGFKAGIYSNIDYRRNMYDAALLAKYVYWLADYTGEPDYPCTFQQYSSTGKVNGISGNVDMNYFYEEAATVSTKTRAAIVAQAQKWIGCKEADGTHKEIIDVYNSHSPLARGYKMKYTDAWCSCFVSACSIATGMTDILPTEVGCDCHIDRFKAIGCWVENDAYTPKPGDVIFYDWNDTGVGDNTGSSDHVGIVETVNGDTMTIIEGNMSDAVGRRTMKVNGKFIRGYGVPKYDADGQTITPAATKTIDELAKEVIAGAWGNGDDRANRLTVAGYDYSAVQKRVNELLTKPVAPKKTIEELAREVIAGKWGNGAERRRLLQGYGYDYNAVQDKVNELLTPKPTKTVDQVAREVIRGDWGNGDERKRKLEAAGFSYREVQNRVNELLKA